MAEGGSTDGTARRARQLGARVVAVERGRGRQLNAGAARARGDVLLFLHADCTLPAGYEQQVCSSLQLPAPGSRRQQQHEQQQQQHEQQQQQPRRPPRNAPRQWGCFESIAIDGPPLTAWVLRHAVALRTRLLHQPYGDQGVFVR